jgi:hypothetical protein
VLVEDALNGVAVGHDPTVVGKLPVVAQDGLEKVAVGACGNAVHRVITAHDRHDLGVAYTALEGLEVVLAELLSGDNRVELPLNYAAPVVQVISGEVLAVGDDLSSSQN